MRTNNPIAAVARLRWVALGAAELLAAHGEHEMATQVGIHEHLAWLFPIGLGVYAFCAFAARSRADVYAALALMTASQSLAHLLAVGVLPRHWWLVVAVSTVAPIICWRVHHLGDLTAHPAAPAALSPTAALHAHTPPEAAHRPAAPVVRPTKPAASVARRGVGTTNTRRSREETSRLVADLRAQHPGITQKAVAAKLGCSDRWIRQCTAAA